MTTPELVQAQRTYFETGATRSADFRLAALKKLQAAVQANERALAEAMAADFRKAPMEVYMTETGMVLDEIRFHLKHLRAWMRETRVPTPLAQFPSRSFRSPEPYGVCLILAPWNYPIQLCLEPLIGAISGGNCAVVKPSAYAPATSAAIAKLIRETFDARYIAAVEGGRAENQALLHQRFDTIFFTGGVTVGREVMRAASETLTPVTLELGGKSPCIVDETANLRVAARRLAFGKLLNCGQTCVAPDYLLISRKVKDAFLPLLEREIQRMVGENALVCDSYVHMVNEKHFRRVCGLIDPDKVIFGGQADERTLRIQPTIMDRVTADDAVMQEEIFGPVLPVIAYDSIDEALAFVSGREHPLALYLFSEDPALQKRVLASVPFGGGCINDTIVHLATSRMGFGGVGHSGMGSYHGKKSFDTFSHEKSVLQKSTRIDMPVRYMPYTPLKDRLLRVFLR